MIKKHVTASSLYVVVTLRSCICYGLFQSRIREIMRLRPSLFLAVFSLAFSALLHGSRAGTLTSVSLSWSRTEPETNLLAISFVLRATWLASTMSSSLERGSTFTDGFFCPIDGQVPKCVAAQLFVVSKHSSQLFTELRTLYTYVRRHFALNAEIHLSFF